MRWSERNAAMLQEMQVRLWLPASARVCYSTLMSDPVSAEMVGSPVLESSRTGNGTQASLVMLSPRQPSVQEMTWHELRAAVSDCTACVLCKGRKRTVFGVGNERAHWMIVGEAPGQNEDLQGEPFVGKAGQLLDSMLHAVGLTRSEQSPERQVFIVNVLKCRPPGNRDPEPHEVAQCAPFLKRQVALVRPRMILAMGRFAVQSLLQSQEPVGRLRGRVHQYEGVPLVVTYHPAYLLRNPLDKARSWEDLCLARELLANQ